MSSIARARRPEGPIRSVLFDKDGTLLDFEASWNETYLRTAEAIGRSWGDRALAAGMLRASGYQFERGGCAPNSVLACGAAPDIAQVWARSAGRRSDAALIERIDTLLASGVRELAQPAIPNLGEVLASLRRQGLLLGVATMDSEASARIGLGALGIADCFEFVCGYDSGFGSKPQPGMVDAFCCELGVVPDSVAVVGDTLHDVHMGLGAGAGLVVAVSGGAGEAAELAVAADVVIDDISHLPRLLSHPET